jgi:hypothetical protein
MFCSFVVDKPLRRLLQIEVSLAVLWEGPGNDSNQIQVHEEIVASTSRILRQIGFWKQAEELVVSGNTSAL